MSTFKNYAIREDESGTKKIVIHKEIAFASLGWKSNTSAQTFSATNEWKDIPSNVALTFGMVSADTATILGDATGYKVRYDGECSINARCAVHFGVDLSGSASIKKVGFRMVYNGTPLTPFLELESNKDGEHGGSEILLQLHKDDELDFEFCNMTDTNSVTVKYMQIVATEL